MAVSNDSPILVIKSTELPCAPQPKQWKPPVGNRVHDGVRSLWNGQRIFTFRLALVMPKTKCKGTCLHLSIESLEVIRVISPINYTCVKVDRKLFRSHRTFVLLNIYLNATVIIGWMYNGYNFRVLL